MARKILAGLMVGVAVLVGGGQGFAQDSGAPPGVSWTGPYVSIGAGAGSFDHDLDVGSSVFENLNILGGFLVINGEIQDQTDFGDDDWNGFGTAGLGYDQQLGSFVVGAFLDFDFHPDSDSTSSKELSGTGSVRFIGIPIANFPLKADVDTDVDLDNVWSVGGRVGYLVQPSILLYALGGYSEANVDGAATLQYATLFNTGPSQAVSVRLPDELHGYIVGGGGEVKVAKNLSVKFEYRYAHYGSENESNSAEVSFGGGKFIDYTRKLDIDTELDADIHSIRGALVFRLYE